MASETITLYSTNDTFDTINKTLTSIVAVSGNYFLRDTSLINPEIDIEVNTSIANANIFYMNSRYYNIVECSLLNGGIYRVKGKLDAYTYKDTILLCKALIERAEDTSVVNKNLVNPDKLCESRTFDTVYNLTGNNSSFLNEPVLIITTVCANDPQEPEV